MVRASQSRRISPSAQMAASGSGRGLVEGDRPRLESLSGGMRPRPGRDTQIPSRSFDRLARWHGVSAAVEPVAPVVGEHDAVGIVGIPAYS